MSKFYKFLSNRRVDEYVARGIVGPDFFIGGRGYESPEAANAGLRRGTKLTDGTRGRLIALVSEICGACGYDSKTIVGAAKDLELFMTGWGLGFNKCTYQWDDTKGAGATNKLALDGWWKAEVGRVCDVARTVLEVAREPVAPWLFGTVRKNSALMAAIARVESMPHNGLRELCEAWWLYNCDTEKFPASRFYYGWKGDEPDKVFSYAKKYASEGVQCVCLMTNTEDIQGLQQNEARTAPDPSEPVICLVTTGYWRVGDAQYVIVDPRDSARFYQQMKDDSVWWPLTRWQDEMV
jgi:hypothetical protein